MVNISINRQIEGDLGSFLRVFPATGIIGPRQVGKTTLSKKYAAKGGYLYLDLENPDDRMKLQDPPLYLGQYAHTTVILDEIQFMPELFNYLRGIIDADRRPGRFILLGSATPDLIRNSADTLAGRIGYLNLTPFMASEVLDEQRLWLRGGFPLSYLADSDEISRLWRSQFIRTYIQRDLGLLGLQTDVVVMERFWRMLAHAQGNILNAERLASSLDISRATIMRFLYFLEGAFMVRLLRPWHANLHKRLVKSPKVYIRDSGLLHSLLAIYTHDALINQMLVGASWEGFVVEQIISAAGGEVQPWFYRTHQGAECDLLLEKNGKLVAAIEIKHGSSPKASKGFYISMQDTNAAQGFIIGTGNETFKTGAGITVTNLKDFLTRILPDL